MLSNGGLPLPAERMPMPANDSAIALEKDAELGPKLEEEVDKKIILKPNEAAREDFLRQSGEVVDFVDSSSQCVNGSKCNVNHSGKLCCDGGVPYGSCEASYSQDCDTTCLAEGGSVTDCPNQCTTASCN